jgi:hypothetical protein
MVKLRPADYVLEIKKEGRLQAALNAPPFLSLKTHFIMEDTIEKKSHS